MNGHELHMALEEKKQMPEFCLPMKRERKSLLGPADDSQERQVDDPRFPVRVGTISKSRFMDFMS